MTFVWLISQRAANSTVPQIQLMLLANPHQNELFHTISTPDPRNGLQSTVQQPPTNAYEYLPAYHPQEPPLRLRTMPWLHVASTQQGAALSHRELQAAVVASIDLSQGGASNSRDLTTFVCQKRRRKVRPR